MQSKAKIRLNYFSVYLKVKVTASKIAQRVNTPTKQSSDSLFV